MQKMTEQSAAMRLKSLAEQEAVTAGGVPYVGSGRRWGRRERSVCRVRFDRFSVKYGRRTVLDLPDGGFALTGEGSGAVVPDGSAGRIIGLFGPNGAGKTTLIRVLTGMSERFRGTLTAPEPDEISYVPDVPYLYPFLSAAACIAQFERRYADFDAGKAHRLVKWLKLPVDRPLRTFSKGQCEQLHLALAFSRRCPLYVLDEPLAAVDPYTRDKLLDVMREAADANATILMSTHIISEIEQVFSRVVMIDSGRIIANDGVAEFERGSGGLEQAFKDAMRRRDDRQSLNHSR